MAKTQISADVRYIKPFQIIALNEFLSQEMDDLRLCHVRAASIYLDRPNNHMVPIIRSYYRIIIRITSVLITKNPFKHFIVATNRKITILHLRYYMYDFNKKPVSVFYKLQCYEVLQEDRFKLCNCDIWPLIGIKRMASHSIVWYRGDL